MEITRSSAGTRSFDLVVRRMLGINNPCNWREGFQLRYVHTHKFLAVVCHVWDRSRSRTGIAFKQLGIKGFFRKMQGHHP